MAEVPVSRTVERDGSEAWYLGRTMLDRVETAAHVDALLSERGVGRESLVFPDALVREAFVARFGAP